MNQPIKSEIDVDLAPFKATIKKRCGLVFGGCRETLLSKGLLARMSERGFLSHEDYLSDLDNNMEEFDLLLSFLLVNETYFFREPRHFELLHKRFGLKLSGARTAGGKLRILSCGCATGEEVYSTAIHLIEQYGVEAVKHFTIIGVDIDEDAIAKARQGIYAGNAFRNINANLKNRYFDEIDNRHFEIKGFVKKAVSFRKFNLIAPSYPQWLKRMDVVFYRNVSIYFDPETRSRVFLNLSETLNDQGYVFVSSTETISHDVGILPLIEIDGVFLFQKNPPPGVKPVRLQGSAKVSSKKTKPLQYASSLEETTKPTPKNKPIKYHNESPRKGKKPKADIDAMDHGIAQKPSYADAFLLAGNKRYQEALDLIDRLMDEELVDVCILKANILINLQQLEAAEALCMKVLDVASLNLQAYLLLGLVAKCRDNLEDAVKKFEKAAYIEPSCWLAHFYQAEIYRSRHHKERAQKHYQIVMKLLEKGLFSAHGFPISPFTFSKEQMLHLCRHNLRSIERIL